MIERMTPMNCNKCGNVIPENSAFCLFLLLPPSVKTGCFSLGWLRKPMVRTLTGLLIKGKT